MLGYHPIIGLITFFLSLIVTVSGLHAILSKGSGKEPWSVVRETSATPNFHKFYGYFIIFIAQIAVNTGIYQYNFMLNEYYKGAGLAAANVIGFFAPLLLLEWRHRKTIKRKVPFKRVAASMSEQLFNTKVKNGENLVILDECVLDISDFTSHHPGG